MDQAKTDTQTETLAQISHVLIHSTLPPAAMSAEVLRFGRILADDPAFDSGAPGLSDLASGTDNGWAISPYRAKMCLADYRRTLEFMRGVFKAVSDLRSRIGDRPVRLLYAGCGPLAPLVMPSLALFEAEALQVTLLDMHEESLRTAQYLIEAHALGDRIAEYVEADAGKYLIDEDAVPDIVLMEILESCLDQEPQVGVSRHLIGQCPDALLIPERISVHLTLANVEKEFGFGDAFLERDRIEVGEIFSLDKVHIQDWGDDTGGQLPAATLTLPEYDRFRYSPLLRTVLQTYGGHGLHEYDSGLTCPRSHASLENAKPGHRLAFHYRTGAQPTLVSVLV